ncbi:hypothetical protein BRC21_02035, partial [Candidatus Saccharibacteria bacterium SW_7_54_9]
MATGHLAARVASGNPGALNQAAALVGAPYLLLQAASVLMLEKTVLALRIVPAMLGILAILLTYLAAQAWFSRRTALVAAFLMASAPWAVHISRLSDYTALVPVLVPLGMWAVARALRSNKALWYVITGLTLGGLSYGGVPFYTWIVLLPALGVFVRRYYRDRMKYAGQPILIVLLSMAIAGAPRIILGVLGSGAERVREVGEAMVLAAQTPVLTGWELLLNGIAGLGLFHIQGDQSVLHNLPGMPLLGGVVGVLFLLGILLALRRFRDIRYGALVITLASLFLVNLFGAGQPAAARNVAMLPIACILAAVGLIELFARWRGVFPRNVLALQLAAGVILLTLGASTFYNWQHYFVAWANTPEVFTAYHERHVQAARYLRDR